MSEPLTEERCFICDSATGRAGQSDDSLFTQDLGPFCSDCWNRLRDDIEAEDEATIAADRERIAELGNLFGEECVSTVNLNAENARLKKVVDAAVRWYNCTDDDTGHIINAVHDYLSPRKSKEADDANDSLMA